MDKKKDVLKDFDMEERYEVLQHAKSQLKKELFGIDNVIDQVVDLCSSWYLYPDLQEKPVVINLWGLTGVGKTCLVKRLSELLKFEERYYHIDVGGNKDGIFTLRDKIEDIYTYDNGFPVMIALDEFQHARSLNEMGFETGNSYARIIWDLLDTGKFQADRDFRDVEVLCELRDFLRFLQGKGVVVKQGNVMKGREIYLTAAERLKFRVFTDEISKHPPILTSEHQNVIYDCMRDQYLNYEVLENQVAQFTLPEVIKLIERAIIHAGSERDVDCTKALIFVLGNLDEAYTMSSNFSTEMDADEFHKQSLTITIPMIKNALKNRLRSEQISRLGNSHIIYPAFNRKTYIQIIQAELNKIAEKFGRKTGLTIHFEESIEELIYQEGVYPTQGTRPVFTTIHQLITSYIGDIVAYRFLENIRAESLRLAYHEHKIRAEFFYQGAKSGETSFTPVLTLHTLRKSRQDDRQAVVAVHESGHAILSSVLLNRIPEGVYSVISDSEGEGATLFSQDKQFTSKDQIIPGVAMLLGGYAAEKIIFGEERITDGCESDISRATGFVMTMVRSSGMGGFPASYQVKSHETPEHLHDTDDVVNASGKEILQKGLQLAEKTLTRERELLLHMADYLSDHRMMDKSGILVCLKNYSVLYQKDKKSFSYRDYLKTQVYKPLVGTDPQVFTEAVLNKNKNCS